MRQRKWPPFKTSGGKLAIVVVNPPELPVQADLPAIGLSV
jgi:hypothetical protein